ncbi:MAG TPA: NADH-quinone oxidoreductase subunit L [candidate division Zixibacteria bacterium]|nr:NADH-quinone oxidoreductase subunit L [candidate division Zixibacteria bacterium]
MLLESAAIMNWAIPFSGALITPIIGFIAGKIKEGTFQKVLYFIRDWMATTTSFVAFIFSLLLVVDVFNGEGGEAFTTNWFWNIGADKYSAGFGVLVDPLTVMIACFASGIGTLIMVYGVNYMKEDKHLDRYWFLMQMFIGGMVFLVMANNFLQSFVGWEIVGFCSYALIGYFFDKKGPQDPKEFTIKEETEGDYNSHAGLKAFITTRIGDVMMLTGILIVFSVAGTFNYTELLANTNWINELADKKILALTAILIFGGPIGKSAQFPLQFWLPEAMAGPTTVSALIHAAAMVKAGVFIVVRTFPMWYIGLHELGHESLQIYFLFVAAIGAFTAIFAASMGMAGTELKKILAFSTVSQLGYMFLGLGAGGLIEPDGTNIALIGIFSGSFHMLSHAIFKALLFLSAGAVIHSVHTKYVDEMGGLKKEIPKVFWPMLIGGFSLAGLPPLGGFFSKETVFGACWELGKEGNVAGWIFFIVAALAAAMTFFYTIRFLGHTFCGEKSDQIKKVEKENHGHLHKPSPLLWVPLWILAAGTIVIGWLSPIVELFMSKNTWFDGSILQIGHIPTYGEFLGHTFGFSPPTFWITLGILALGGIPAYLLFVRKQWDTKEILAKSKFANGLNTLLYKRWYMNHAIYHCLRKFQRFTELAYEYFDLKVIDRGNYVIASGTMKSGEVFRKTHTGVLSVNFLYMLFGAIILIVILLFAL